VIKVDDKGERSFETVRIELVSTLELGEFVKISSE
jgi:hypothetical protein